MSPARRYLLTHAAETDLIGVLRSSHHMFGPKQREIYAALIERAVEFLADEPLCPGSRPRPEIAQDVRSYHLELAAGRRGGASHVIYYIVTPAGLAVLRILHERMDAPRHFPDTP